MEKEPVSNESLDTVVHWEICTTWEGKKVVNNQIKRLFE